MAENRPERGPVYAMIAEYANVTAAVRAAKQVREAGYTRWDLHSPFPIHGVHKVLGMRPTILPWLTLGGGLIGLLGGLLLVWWTNATMFEGVPTTLQGYPYLVSGKPQFSLPANIAIIFETTVLLAALATVFGVFALNGMPMLYNPLFKSRRFRRVTEDRFFILIDGEDAKFDPRWTRQFLESLDPLSIEQVHLDELEEEESS